MGIVNIIIGTIKLPFAIVGKIGDLVGKIFHSTEISTENISDFMKYKENLENMRVVYLTEGRFFETTGKVDANLTKITPANMEREFKLNGTWTDINGQEVAVLIDDFPASVNGKENITWDNYEMPIIELEGSNDKDTKIPGKVKTKKVLGFTLNYRKYKIYGGKILSQVAFFFLHTIFMSLLRPASKIEIRNAMITAGAICLVVGVLGTLLVVGIFF